MPRISIDDFRARLTGAADPLAQVYREITRRPELRRPAALRIDWTPWTEPHAPAAAA